MSKLPFTSRKMIAQFNGRQASELIAEGLKIAEGGDKAGFKNMEDCIQARLEPKKAKRIILAMKCGLMAYDQFKRPLAPEMRFIIWEADKGKPEQIELQWKR